MFQTLIYLLIFFFLFLLRVQIEEARQQLRNLLICAAL